MATLAQALLNNASLLLESGRLDEAAARLQEALQSSPPLAEAHLLLGSLRARQGRLDEAIASYQHGLSLRPDLPESHSNLGNLLAFQGRFDEAVASHERAVALKPEMAELHCNLGKVLWQQGKVEQAETTYRKALTLKPDLPEALVNLGVLDLSCGRLDAAAASLQQAVRIRPAFPEAWTNLGLVFCKLGKLPEAIACHQQAVRLKPDYAEAFNNLATALMDQGAFDDAVICYQRALRHSPAEAGTYSNLANAFMEKHCFEQALACYDKACALKPADAGIRWNRGLALLLLGNFEQGLAEFEWRLLEKSLGLNRDFTQPRWDGSDPAGHTILLHAEGGFGDALQFVRYAPLVAQRGGRVILECQAELKSLLQTVPGVSEVVVRGDKLPEVDAQIPLQSLPKVFGTTLATIPANVPYIAVDPQRQAWWAGRWPSDQRLYRVGLVWSGKPKRMKRNIPAIPLANFRPLADVDGVQFYSLQKGPAATETPPAGMTLVDWTPDLTDFADTAALISQLDLVISVDTSVAHLAGALGKPVWTLLPRLPDFRWLLGRDDCPWYPTMRLFRQTVAGDWDEVIQRVTAELAAVVSRDRAVRHHANNC